MSQEATIICLDNSEWARDGDFVPSRWEAQQDAASLLVEAKTQRNAENAVGILSMSGRRPEVLAAPTTEISKILAALHTCKVNGRVDLVSSLQIAALALKHRPNRSAEQRIVVFLCSPTDVDLEKLSALGATFKRNSVKIDIVSFGCQENEGALTALFEAVNTGGSSHYVVVPSELGTLTDHLINTPVFQSGDAAANPGQLAEFGGVDPNIDPELAMAIRISLEEAKAREGQHEPAGDQQGQQPMDLENEDEELARALQLSRDVASESTVPPVQPPQSTDAGEPQANVYQDPDFVRNLLSSLPGVDIGSESVQEALEKRRKEEDKQEEDKEK
jgi:26S proteasome regulatory subunit N10